MLRIAALIALAVLTVGCAGNRIETAKDGAAVPAGHGVLVVGLDRTGELSDVSFAIEIRSVDGQGRVDAAPHSEASPSRASVMLPREHWMNATPSRSQAFALAPGDYALTKVHVPVEQTTYRPYSSSNQGGARLDTGAAIGVIGVLAVLTAVAIGVAATSDAPPPPMNYVEKQIAVAHAPRFQIRPGEVVYIGHILMGLEVREQQVENPWGGRGPNALDEASTTTIADKRVFAEHAFDLPQAKAFVAGLGLGRRPFRTQQIRLSGQARTMLYGYGPPDPKLPVRYALARPDLPRQSAGPVTATVTVPVTAPGSSRNLMERFLAGEISKEEYDRERARRAAGP